MDLGRLLTKDRVAVGLKASDWRDAISQIGKLMVDSGAVEERYIDAMIHTAEELGPYIVIAPGIAMPHARPEDGVISPCMALATIHEPIYFGNPENDPVSLMFALGAVDKHQHIEALAEIASIFSSLFDQYGDLHILSSAKNKDDLFSVIFDRHIQQKNLVPGREETP